MDSQRPLAPVLVGRGTLSDFRDMLRALETIENLEYRFVVDGALVDEGGAALVKLMADPESATMIVNGCLFLNVASFRYLDFESADEGRWSFTLHGDGHTLELIALPDSDEEGRDRPHLLALDETADFESLILLDEDDEDD